MKFKVGDIVIYQEQDKEHIYIDRIIDIKDNTYTINVLWCSTLSLENNTVIDCEQYESRANLLTDEKKLEYL